MSETLYRKYRPAKFADVAEQAHVVKTIQNQIASGTLAHAYLLAGPRGVGKTTIARLLAKAVNCLQRAQGESEPCGECEHCLAFAEGRFLDTIEIDAASNTGVDNVRENIIENVRFVPQQGQYKVFIIDEVHMLSSSAFNALLKTLEEPPAHVIFILATTELHKIPATIISRCQRFDFSRIPAAEMIVRLKSISQKEGVEVDDEVLRVMAKISEGCLRDAESLLGQVLSLGDKRITVELAAAILPVTTLALVKEVIDGIVSKDVKTVLEKLAGFVADGGSVKHLIDELIEEVRENLMAAVAGSKSVFTAVEARRLLDLLLTARGRNSLAILPQLPLELALVEFVLGDDSLQRGMVTPPIIGANNSIDGVTMPHPIEKSIPMTLKAASLSSAPSLVSPRPVVIAEVKIESEIGASSAGQGGNSSREGLNDVINGAQPITFTLEEIQDKWERCCDKVADKNIALPMGLRVGKPTKIDGDKLTITFPYSFHADALKDGKNLRLLEDAIAAVMLQKPRIVTEVVPQVEKEEETVALFADAFGGEVVE